MLRQPLTEAEKQGLGHFRDSLQSLLGENLLSLRLFGSRARGEGTEESDLDVLVLMQKKDRDLCRRIVEESLEVDLVYGTNLAPTILTADEYRQIWASEGARIVAIMERATGLAFPDRPVSVVVYEGVSWAGRGTAPMRLRAS